MNEKKRGMGFRTPTQEMQETLDKVRAELEQTKTDWGKIGELASTTLDEVNAQTLQMMVKKDKTPLALVVLANYLFYLNTQLQIAKLGGELATTHQRLADVEKSIKELSRRIK